MASAANVLLLGLLLATTQLLTRSADVVGCGASDAECIAAGSDYFEEEDEEEEEEDQALLQTAGAKLLNPTKPASGQNAIEHRPALEAMEASQEPLMEEEALLQLPGKAKMRARLTPEAAAKPPSQRAEVEANPSAPKAEAEAEEAAAPSLTPAPASPRRHAPLQPPKEEQGGASPAGAALTTLWDAPHPVNTTLKVISILFLAAAGFQLRHQRLAKEARKAELSAGTGDAKPPPDPNAESDSSSSRGGESGEPQAELPPPVALSQVGASYALPIFRIARSQAPTLSVEVPVSPAVWPLSATFARLPGEAAWAKVDLTVDVIDAAGLPPLLSCGPPAAAAKLASSEGTGGTGAADDGGWTAPGDDVESGAARLFAAADAAATKACLEIRRGNGQMAAWIVKEQEEGLFSVKRPSHHSWAVRVSMVGGECRIMVSKSSQDIGTASMLTDNRKSWSGEDAMEKEVKMVQIDTLPDTSNPESVLLLMCMMSLMVFQP